MPHAGYIYSGFVAAATISKINAKKTYIILGPNHTGMGTAFSLMSKDDWQTPLGLAAVDKKLCGEILASTKFIKEDSLAHAYEHSIEVQLPLLQYLYKNDFKIVPMIIASVDPVALKAVGMELAMAIKKEKMENEILIIASSDMTHYESQQEVEAKDKMAIDAILKLDEDLLLKRIKEDNITMCGFAPAMVMLSAVKFLGAKESQLVKYQTSGQVSGDYSAVVGYAGIIIN
jgi:AmmeMemoRadiSam system protein B